MGGVNKEINKHGAHLRAYSVKSFGTILSDFTTNSSKLSALNQLFSIGA